MTPRTMATRYRIWGYATAREWNVTIADIAEGLDLAKNTVQQTIIAAKWFDRIRAMSHSNSGPVPYGESRAADIAHDVASGRINMTMGDL
jgi:hypothetical protein